MNYILTFIKTVDKINRVISERILWFLVSFLVLTLVYEVFMRYVIGKPTLWSYDVSYMSASLFIAFGMAYTLQKKGHVSVDIFYSKFPRRIQLLINIFFTLLLFFPLWILFVYYNVPHLLRSWAMTERASVGTWLPPIYPFKTWVLISIILLIFQGISEFLKDILEFIGIKSPFLEEEETNES